MIPAKPRKGPWGLVLDSNRGAGIHSPGTLLDTCFRRYDKGTGQFELSVIWTARRIRHKQDPNLSRRDPFGFFGPAKTFLRVSLQRILGTFLRGRGGALALDVPILYNRLVASADE